MKSTSDPLPPLQAVKESKRQSVRDFFVKVSRDSDTSVLRFYENNSGTLRKTLNDLCVDATEQCAWLNIWMTVDPDRKNKMSFNEFCNMFQFEKQYEWTRRLFDIINKKLTGVISLDELLSFCLKYLILDVEATREFTFRLLSRRAGTCDSYTVLDLQDMKTYLKFSYKTKKSQLDKVAMEIFNEMDDSGDFGVAMTEFSEYGKRNPTFLTFGNAFLTHFRMCLFGHDFWIKRSRKVKKSRAVGFGSFVRLKNANLEAEELVRMLLKRAGINPSGLKRAKGRSKSGRGESVRGISEIGGAMSRDVVETGPGLSKQRSLMLSFSGLKKAKASSRSGRGESIRGLPEIGGTVSGDERHATQGTDIVEAAPGLSKQRSIMSSMHRISSLYIGRGTSKRAIKGRSGDEGELLDDEDEVGDEESEESRQERLNNLVLNAIKFDYSKISSGSFEKDFPDVLLSRHANQTSKIETKKQYISSMIGTESRTYTLLTMALDDLLHQRRGKRIAFGRWLDAVGMEGTTEEMYRSESTQRKRDALLKAKQDEDSSQTFVLDSEEEYKLHARIVELTKHIRESGADEETFSDYMREYMFATQRNCFHEDRTHRIKETLGIPQNRISKTYIPRVKQIELRD